MVDLEREIEAQFRNIPTARDGVLSIRPCDGAAPSLSMPDYVEHREELRRSAS